MREPRKFMFATDEAGRTREVTAPSSTALHNIKAAALRDGGESVTILDADERIKYANITDQLLGRDR